MKQSFITISGLPNKVLTNLLIEFANLFSDEKFQNEILLYKEKKTGTFLILFVSIPSFDHFCYCVNFIRYMETPNNQLPLVYGYYFNEGESHSFLTKGFVKIYVSSSDIEYNNVHVVNNTNETYFLDFGAVPKLLSINEEFYEVPVVDLGGYEEVVFDGEVVGNNRWWRFW
ncbi:MAG: hypothetical protein Q8K02_08965 [Flavobacterium sp.]|nr:hypothetical protein [Flavobacterium sp.]